MRIKFFLDKLKSEKAASSIVEYSIVLPICLVIFAMLFMIGYMLNQQANLDAATNRGVLVAQKVYSDPNVDSVMDLAVNPKPMQVGFTKKPGGFSFNANYKCDPYRYLGSGYRYDTIAALVKLKVMNCIQVNQIVGVGDRVSTVNVEMPNEFSGFIMKKMSLELILELLQTITYQWGL